MQVGELWWLGKEEALSTKLDKMSPACLSVDKIINEAMITTPAVREGFAFKASELMNDRAELQLNLYTLWKCTMEATVAATESTLRAQSSIDGLRKTLVEFRGALKNDLSSMKAASERVQSEVLQMQEKYRKAQEILTTPEFMQAIENAERMATALASIQKLTETKVSVAVFGGGKVSDEPSTI